jgi:AcrR family transcriptional regulator
MEVTDRDAPAALPPVMSEHRSRLLEGMARAVAAKGYADTTIADIVREASVSRRTFYEHFQSKAECLVALYEAASHNALGVLKSAIDPTHDWQGQVEAALGAYLGCMAGAPELLRTLFIEILGLGAEGLTARRRVMQEIADFMRDAINTPSHAPLSPQMAMAIVGATNELILEYIEQDQAARLEELVVPASALVRAIVGVRLGQA